MAILSGQPQPPGMHVAQLNVGRAIDDLEGATLAPFMQALDAINAVAERSDGFVWRYQTEAGNATDLKLTDDPRFIVNLSVWETPQALEHFVWQTVHRRFYERKAEWFEPLAKPHFVMWWVPEGARPTPQEALARLDLLQRQGSSQDAFGWEGLVALTRWREARCG
ncbi:MAG: DUF3291 domain-containing protein [Pseudomonadota bacterium]